MHTVCKCALGSARITQILGKYYNTIMNQRYYPKQWLEILKVMIKKGKGAKLGKLQTIQLIEADLKIIMRIGINI